MERRYSTRQMDELLSIKQNIQAHSKLSSEDALALFKWVKELYYSGIPNAYWNLSLETLQVDVVAKKIVKEYLQHLTNAVREGLGIAFLGSFGVGKTSLMCEIGKAALMSGHSLIYTTLESYIDSIHHKERENDEASLLYDKVWNSQFILIDEVDKAYVRQGSDWVAKQFIDLLKGTAPYHKVVITAMNASKEELKDTFGGAVDSAMVRHLKTIPVAGQDYSPNQQKDWLTKLKEGNGGLWHRSIVQQALHYSEAIQKLTVQLYDEVW